MDDYLNRERERERLWGPSPQKVSWTELCKRLIAKDPTFAKENSVDGSPPFMSDQILRLWGKNISYGWHENESKKILLSLRPEDAIHVPQLRFDYETGKIIEWNRSMSDLSGIAAAQVVGKTYAKVLEEFIPNLSKEYKDAAVEWVKRKEDDKLGHLNPYSSDYAENCRAGYLFPLPLPLRYDSSFKYVSGKNRHYDEYIELLAARSDRLFELYPKLNRVPQCKLGEVAWNFDTSGWVGGIEFTLRRKQYLPSLQTLCRELLPKGVGHAVNEDGSLAVTKSVSETSSKGEDDVYTTISNYVRSCGPIGIKYIREVMNAVCKKCRNQFNMRTKVFHFSTDWSSHAETAAIHKHVLQALGGADLITEKVEKDKMTWNLNFGPEKAGDEDLPKYILRDMERKISDACSNFKMWITPVLRENKNFTFPCGASDSTFVLPTADKPELTVLTLKIEGRERSDGSYGEEKFKAFATVQVPASLNFFQLHRVVCQTMNCSSSGTREAHEWTVPNVASDYEKPITDRNLEYLTLGETYFVENGKRIHDDWGCKEVFDTGCGIRQRVSRTGAYVDQDMSCLSSGDECGPLIFERRSVGRMKACIHSTCINSVFFQPGTVALMKDGLVKYFTTYKITCTKSEEYTGPLPLNPDINVMQPKCLRGKPEEGHEYWSVDKVNEQLHQDRGCLRRNLCKVGADDYLVQMPWCRLLRYNPWCNSLYKLDGTRFHAPFPVAVHLTGLDHYPMFLHGEPPLPSSEAYEDYVSTLNGRIDPRFLQENLTDMGGDFAVSFEYGAPRRREYSYDSDGNESGQSCAIGQVWTREVDEEMKRIDSLQPIKKAKGKKRKAPSKTPAS